MTKVILVTGGSDGIGAATVRLAAQQGYSVCINYLTAQEKAEQLAEEISARGRKAIAVKANISDEGEVKSLFETIDRKLGRLTALVNNAGILEKQTTVENLTAERLTRIFAVNVTGSFLCARESIRRMSVQHGGAGGAIVNISSVAAKIGAPFEYVDYAASKGAVDTMTVGLAKEVATQGIRVNAVRPGLILTDIHAKGGEPGRVERLKHSVPMQRGGTAAETAQAILWLLSEDASYVTGAILDVSGGR